MDNIYSSLIDNGFKPEQDLSYRKTVSVSEHRKSYLLDVSDKKKSAQFQVDGYIIVEGQKCDKLILVEFSSDPNSWAEILVELKGTDVSHAVDQLESSLKNEKLQHKTITERRARIVATSFPASKSDPIMEKAKKRFRQLYQCDLRGFKSMQKDNI